MRVGLTDGRETGRKRSFPKRRLRIMRGSTPARLDQARRRERSARTEKMKAHRERLRAGCAGARWRQRRMRRRRERLLLR